VKNDFRIARNFLKHTLGDEMNAIMAAAAFNFKKWMRMLGVYLHLFILKLCTLFWRLVPANQGHKLTFTDTF